MQSIIDSVKSLTLQDWATAGSLIFGIITLLAYLDQRRNNKKQENLLEFVDRHVAKDISEERIKELEQQQESMQEQVSQNIPALARAAVLQEQSEAHANATSKHFLEWKRLQDEMENSPSGGIIDPSIEKVIIDKLVPKYERQEELDNIRNRITMISVALALISGLFPYPLNSLVGAILALPLISSLLKFYKLSTTY